MKFKNGENIGAFDGHLNSTMLETWGFDTRFEIIDLRNRKINRIDPKTFCGFLNFKELSKPRKL